MQAIDWKMPVIGKNMLAIEGKIQIINQNFQVINQKKKKIQTIDQKCWSLNKNI